MFIDQVAGLSKVRYGLVLRSSGIFYYVKNKNCRTVLSILDSWRVKRGLEVSIYANVRNLDGSLIAREPILFTDGTVCNFEPSSIKNDFEGSVEIEIFSLEDMKIPVAGIMACYLSSNGVNLVHTYGRTYTANEIEEGRTITDGEDSCWTVHARESVNQIGVFHNGGAICSAQEISFILTDSKRKTTKRSICLPELRPYETVIINVSDHFPDLSELLDGTYGNLAISYKLENSFTRMLIGSISRDWTDAQFTHTNFNYSKHSTNLISEGDKGYMYVPGIQNIQNSSIVVYPDFDSGEYSVQKNDEAEENFSSGDTVNINAVDTDPYLLTFSRFNNRFPARLVTGIRLSNTPDVISAECSLNIVHKNYYKKFNTWGPVVAEKEMWSEVYFTECETAHGYFNDNDKGILILYSAITKEYLEKNLDRNLVDQFHYGMKITDIFTEAETFLGGEIGYLYLKTEYPGFINYSVFRNSKGSVTIEHWF